MKQLARSLALASALAACGGGALAPAQPDPAGGAGGGSGCARAIAIRCASGVDGCDGGKTTDHVCVPQDATPGPACELELALVCPAGQIDGCLRSPPAAARHICVFR